MRVLLTNLPTLIAPEEECEHLGLAYLAAVLRKAGHEVEIIDATLDRLNLKRAIREILKRKFDILGISVIFQERVPDLIYLVKALREAGLKAHITVGGHPPTFLYEEILNASRERGKGKGRGHGTPTFHGTSSLYGADSVALGEGEMTMLELVNKIEGGEEWRGLAGLAFLDGDKVVVGPPRGLICDLDSLPFPERDNLTKALGKDRSVCIYRSRGCYGNCSFCTTRAFHDVSIGPLWRSRSAGNVADEIEELIERWGAKDIQIWDDNFMGPGELGRRHAREFADELIKRNFKVHFSMACRVNDVDEGLFALLKEAGLNRVFLGVESGHQRGLDTFNKGATVELNRAAISILQKLQIPVTAGFIMFDPYTSFEEFLANLNFYTTAFGSWRGARQHVPNPLNVLQVFVGSPMERRLREEGRLCGSYGRYDYHVADPRVNRLIKMVNALRGFAIPVRNRLLRPFKSRRISTAKASEPSGLRFNLDHNA